MFVLRRIVASTGKLAMEAEANGDSRIGKR
jgi:hypothetical protein